MTGRPPPRPFNPNYSAKVPSSSSFSVKTFQETFEEIWTYTKIDGEVVITPASSSYNVYLSNDLTINTNLIVNGTITNPSDIILKTNIKPLKTNESLLILKLNPCIYNFKQNINDLHYGFIAQEVENIYPNLVKTINNIKTLNYLELIPIIISNIQNIYNEINNLKNNI